MKRSIFHHILLAGMLAGTLAAASSAAALSCGTTITVDTVLDNDITCPGSDPAVIVSGATLDLQGHVISGDVNGPGVVLSGHGARLINGTVTQAKPAIRAEGSGGHVIQYVRTYNNLGGLILNSPGNVVSNCVLATAGNYSVNVNSNGNSLRHNTLSSGAAATVDLTGSDNELVGNVVRGVGGNGIEASGNGNNLVGNVFVGNSTDLKIAGNGNKVTANTLSAALQIGIEITGSENSISKNSISDCASDGVRISGDGNKLSENSSVHNDIAFHIFGDDNQLTGNQAAASFGIGIFIEATAANSQVLKNRLLYNAGGLYMDGHATTIKGNFAVDNNFDLVDDNPNCGDNKWSNNLAGNASPNSCIE